MIDISKTSLTPGACFVKLARRKRQEFARPYRRQSHCRKPNGRMQMATAGMKQKRE
jgi:hypothetical protein